MKLFCFWMMAPVWLYHASGLSEVCLSAGIGFHHLALHHMWPDLQTIQPEMAADPDCDSVT